MSKIKICGLKRMEDIQAVNKVNPDYAGFVFAPSKRQIDAELASELKAALNPGIKTVGVFVNADREFIFSLCKKKTIDIIQLHGDEGNEEVLKLKEQTSNTIIQVVRVASEEDIKKAKDLICDYLLFDTYTRGAYGGAGITFPWEYLKDIEKPYFLAGGIGKDNVVEAMKQCQPFCIDVSSGVETDGYKDEMKIKEIVKLVRSV